MSSRHGVSVSFALALTTFGCGEVIDEGNQHAACVNATEPGDNSMVDPEAGPTMSFMADAPLWVTVDHGCRPCAQDLEKGCTVEVESDQIIIETTFNYEKSRRPCDAICAFISSKCQTPEPVPAGTYTIVYGDRTATLEIPSTTEAPCFSRL